MRLRLTHPTDLEGIVKLLNLSFGVYRREGLDPAHYRGWIEDDPGIGWGRTVVAEDNGEIIGHLNMVPAKINLKGEWTEAAGIANVGVHPQHRRRGIANALLDYALAHAQAPIAALFAGFGEAAHALYRLLEFKELHFMRYAIILRDDLYKPGITDAAVRPADNRDTSTIFRIYAREALNWTGMVWRNEDFFAMKFFHAWSWHMFFYDHTQRANILLAEPDRGYAVLWPADEKTPLGMRTVGELFWSDQQACVALLRAVFAQTEARSLRVYTPVLPPAIPVRWFTTPETLMIKPLNTRDLGPNGLAVQTYVFPTDRW